MARKLTGGRSDRAAHARARAPLVSFGAELFCGNLRLDLIHPQPELDCASVEKGERFLADLRDFLEREVDPLQIERDAKIPEHVIDGLKRLGALGIKIPEEYGGLGLPFVYYARTLMLTASWHSALPAMLIAQQSIGVSQPLLLLGTEEQRRRWLPLVARTHISAFLQTEAGAGSDPSRMTTTAVPTEDGSGYVINGRKQWSTNGAIADVVVVMAKVPESDGHRGGISAFVVPYDSPGITVEHRNQFMGLRGIENSITLLEDVFVPAENLIGEEGDGPRITQTTLASGRLALLAVPAGVAKWASKVAREWSLERVQWGAPIGKHDAVAQKLAFIAATAFALEAMTEVAARMADDPRSDMTIVAAMCKVYGSEMGWRVVDELMQVRGGRGFETAESLKARGEKPVPVEQAMRDMRINRIFEGATEVLHQLIASEILRGHAQVAGPLLAPDAQLADRARGALKVGMFYARWLPQLALGKGSRPGAYSEFGELAEHLRQVERHSRKLARAIFYGMTRWRAGITRRQAFFGRAIDIGSELFAASAACVYALALGQEHPERGEEAVELADLFCRQSRRRVERLFTELWANDDEANYEGGQRLLDGRYRWLDEGVLDPSGEGPMIPGWPEELLEALMAT